MYCSSVGTIEELHVSSTSARLRSAFISAAEDSIEDPIHAIMSLHPENLMNVRYSGRVQIGRREGRPSFSGDCLPR